MNDIRAHARGLVRQAVSQHRVEYSSCGVSPRRITINKTGFVTYMSMDGKVVWKISVKNVQRKNAPDRVWVEDEYVGPTSVLTCSESLHSFMPLDKDAIRIIE